MTNFPLYVHLTVVCLRCGAEHKVFGNDADPWYYCNERLSLEDGMAVKVYQVQEVQDARTHDYKGE